VNVQVSQGDGKGVVRKTREGPVQPVNDEIVPENVVAPFTVSVNMLPEGAVDGKIEQPGKLFGERLEAGTTIVTLVSVGVWGSSA
jgi:hypothetical protein